MSRFCLRFVHAVALGAESLDQHPALCGSERLESMKGFLHALPIGWRHRLECMFVACGIASLFGSHLRPALEVLLDLFTPIRR